MVDLMKSQGFTMENIMKRVSELLDNKLPETGEFSGNRKRGNSPKPVVKDFQTPPTMKDDLSRKDGESCKIPKPVDGSSKGKSPLINVEQSIEKDPEAGIGSSALKDKASDCKLPETGKLSGKRKRGRPRKQVIKDLEIPPIMKGNAEKRAVSSNDFSRKDGNSRNWNMVDVDNWNCYPE